MSQRGCLATSRNFRKFLCLSNSCSLSFDPCIVVFKKKKKLNKKILHFGIINVRCWQVEISFVLLFRDRIRLAVSSCSSSTLTTESCFKLFTQVLTWKQAGLYHWGIWTPSEMTLTGRQHLKVLISFCWKHIFPSVSSVITTSHRTKKLNQRKKISLIQYFYKHGATTKTFR